MPALNAGKQSVQGACVPGKCHRASGNYVHILLLTHPNAVFMLLLTCGPQTGSSQVTHVLPLNLELSQQLHALTVSAARSCYKSSPMLAHH